MRDIEILESCTRCNACFELCPSMVFEQQGNSIVVVNPGGCIGCGHCVAICPKGSVQHSEFPCDRVHEVGRAEVDSAELLKMIRLRRSNRSFTNREIPQEALDMIIEAAYRAPTASNMQGVKFLLVRDREVLDRVIDATMGYYRRIMRLVDNPVVRPLAVALSPTVGKYLQTFKRMIAERAAGGDPILRGGKAMLVIYSDRSSRFGCEDSNLAYQNASLMAESLGVAQVYTGFVCNVSHSSSQINRILGIQGYRIQAGMVLGMSGRRFTKYVDKRDIDFKEL